MCVVCGVKEGGEGEGKMDGGKTREEKTQTGVGRRCAERVVNDDRNCAHVDGAFDEFREA